MIQRIQSLYLLLTTLFPFLFLKGSFLKFIDKSGILITITFKGIFRDRGMQSMELIEKVLPLSVIICILPVLSIITLIIYKNRKIQLWLSSFLIFLVGLLIIVFAFYTWNISKEYGAIIAPGFKMVVPPVMLIFVILANRAIKKDDRLIKSYNRLR